MTQKEYHDKLAEIMEKAEERRRTTKLEDCLTLVYISLSDLRKIIKEVW